VLAEAAVGEARAVAADMAPGAHPQLEVAPRLVGAAPSQVAVLAGQLHHPYAAGPEASPHACQAALDSRKSHRPDEKDEEKGRS